MYINWRNVKLKKDRWYTFHSRFHPRNFNSSNLNFNRFNRLTNKIRRNEDKKPILRFHQLQTKRSRMKIRFVCNHLRIAPTEPLPSSRFAKCIIPCHQLSFHEYSKINFRWENETKGSSTNREKVNARGEWRRQRGFGEKRKLRNEKGNGMNVSRIVRLVDSIASSRCGSNRPPSPDKWEIPPPLVPIFLASLYVSIGPERGSGTPEEERARIV